MEEDRVASGPRRSGLVQERSRRTRRTLVDAALALWTERGFDDGIDETTVEEIAQAAGVTKGTFYFHFAHKEDILLEIGWGTAEAMLKDTTKYIADERPVEDAFDKLLTALARRISAGPRAAVGRTIAEFYRRPARGRRSGWHALRFPAVLRHADRIRAADRAAPTRARCARRRRNALLTDNGRDQRLDPGRGRRSRGGTPIACGAAPRRNHAAWRRWGDTPPEFSLNTDPWGADLQRMRSTERRGIPAAPLLTTVRDGFWWRHPRAVHIAAVAALCWGAIYLGWRVGWSGGGIPAVLFMSLFVAELFGWVSLGLYAFLAWRVPASRRRPLPQVLPSIDVFVCTYDESRDVLEATLAGCRAIRVPHTTYLLDDGRRPELRMISARLGAQYVTRPDNTHAKAGNINHALGVTSGELVLFLDADHVPLPEILDATVGYFANPDVALVQTPHDFSNRDSVQHTRTERHEQTLFYEVIAPGKGRCNAMFWCGSATARPARRARGCRGRAHRHGRRGFPHHDRNACARVEDLLPQRGSRPRSRAARSRGLPPPASTLGTGEPRRLSDQGEPGHLRWAQRRTARELPRIALQLLLGSSAPPVTPRAHVDLGDRCAADACIARLARRPLAAVVGPGVRDDRRSRPRRARVRSTRLGTASSRSA